MLFWLIAGFASAQYTVQGMVPLRFTPPECDTVWIIGGKKELPENFKRWKMDFVLDARQTLLSNKTVRLGGIRVGLEYRRVHRFGIGIYGIGDDVQTESLNEVDSAITSATLNMGYASIFYERVLFFNPKWEWAVTVHQGIGRITGSYRYEPGTPWYSYEARRVRPFEISTMGYYNLTWWCSAGVGVGYRYMRRTPAEVRDVYSAPLAIVRLRIKFGKLTRSLWNKEVRHEY